MSKKLNQKDETIAMAAIKKFKRDCIGDRGYKVYADITVLESNEDDEDNYLFTTSVDVHADIGTNFHKILIMWEQAFGDDFREKDSEIYGIYRSDYQKMKYNYRELTILSDERTIIIRA